MGLSFRYQNDELKDKIEYDGGEQRPFTAEETIANVIDTCFSALEEMCDSERNGEKLSEYAEGLKSAYVEILEILQKWEKKDEYGLGFDVEHEFSAH